MCLPLFLLSLGCEAPYSLILVIEVNGRQSSYVYLDTKRVKINAALLFGRVVAVHAVVACISEVLLGQSFLQET